VQKHPLQFTQVWSNPNSSVNEVFRIVKIHGNWCGPNWTAGRRISAQQYRAEGGQFDEPCVDKLDCGCRKHDRDCSDPPGCSRKGDTELIKTALEVASNPRNRLFNPQLANTAALLAAGITAARTTRRR